MLNLIKHAKDIFQGKAKPGRLRSPKWRSVRRVHLQENPNCALCGSKKKLEVHHVVPFHVDPKRELDPANLITLCESKKNGLTCHQFVGHLGNYRWANDRIQEDIHYLRERLREVRQKHSSYIPTAAELVEELRSQARLKSQGKEPGEL